MVSNSQLSEDLKYLKNLGKMIGETDKSKNSDIDFLSKNCIINDYELSKNFIKILIENNFEMEVPKFKMR